MGLSQKSYIGQWPCYSFLCLLLLLFMINIPKSDFRMSLYGLHKATGLLLFALFILRIVWRFVNIQPVLSAPKWQQYTAHANIFFFYSLMLLMPTTGFLTQRWVVMIFHLFIIRDCASGP